jgi:DNA polymerase III delta subunit
MIYLFLGQDSSLKDSSSSSKDAQLKQIKDEFLPREVAQFNLDLLYAQTLKLKDLQEKLLALPVKSPKRIVVIKNAQELDKDVENFIEEWARLERKDTVLILDIEEQGKKEGFLRNINKYAKVFRFKEPQALNTFNLTRQIAQRNAGIALKTLEQLIKDGERPERILGGLRYTLENSSMSFPDVKRRIKMLLECDIEIKTGRTKPVFALEKLIVRLCALVQPLH